MRMGQGVRTGLGHGGFTCVINSSQGFQAFILKLCTAIKSMLKVCMCFFFAHKNIFFVKITAILTDISDISLQY